jgi:hypothetical protein
MQLPLSTRKFYVNKKNTHKKTRKKEGKIEEI